MTTKYQPKDCLRNLRYNTSECFSVKCLDPIRAAYLINVFFARDIWYQWYDCFESLHTTSLCCHIQSLPIQSSYLTNFWCTRGKSAVVLALEIEFSRNQTHGCTKFKKNNGRTFACTAGGWLITGDSFHGRYEGHLLSWLIYLLVCVVNWSANHAFHTKMNSYSFMNETKRNYVYDLHPGSATDQQLPKYLLVLLWWSTIPFRKTFTPYTGASNIADVIIWNSTHSVRSNRIIGKSNVMCIWLLAVMPKIKLWVIDHEHTAPAICCPCTKI